MKAGISSSMLLAALLASMPLLGCSPEQAYREVNGVPFPVNSSGQTYGSASSANVPEDLDGPSGKARAELLDCYPDLILTTTADGREGYMYKEDFLPELAPSPEEAASGAYSTGPGGSPRLRERWEDGAWQKMRLAPLSAQPRLCTRLWCVSYNLFLE